MKLSVYSVYDVKTCTYSTPFFSTNDSVALRSFKQLEKDPNSALYHFPGDFKLFRIGEFDDSDGMIAAESPALIHQGHQTTKEG